MDQSMRLMNLQEIMDSPNGRVRLDDAADVCQIIRLESSVIPCMP